MKKIKLIPVEHKGANRLLVEFAYDNELIGIIKKWKEPHSAPLVGVGMLRIIRKI